MRFVDKVHLMWSRRRCGQGPQFSSGAFNVSLIPTLMDDENKGVNSSKTAKVRRVGWYRPVRVIESKSRHEHIRMAFTSRWCQTVSGRWLVSSSSDPTGLPLFRLLDLQSWGPPGALLVDHLNLGPVPQRFRKIHPSISFDCVSGQDLLVLSTSGLCEPRTY